MHLHRNAVNYEISRYPVSNLLEAHDLFLLGLMNGEVTV